MTRSLERARARAIRGLQGVLRGRATIAAGPQQAVGPGSWRRSRARARAAGRPTAIQLTSPVSLWLIDRLRWRCGLGA